MQSSLNSGLLLIGAQQVCKLYGHIQVGRQLGWTEINHQSREFVFSAYRLSVLIYLYLMESVKSSSSVHLSFSRHAVVHCFIILTDV